MAKSTTPTVKVGARGRARVASGHPWIYRQDVLAGPERDARTDGPALVLVTDERNRPLAIATWSLESPIALRVLSPLPAKRGEGQGEGLPDFLQLVEARLERARSRRAGSPSIAMPFAWSTAKATPCPA
jgi:23S rRNA G2069 N7-methylase RlmK/C1962 C5-methylase RlmI